MKKEKIDEFVDVLWRIIPEIRKKFINPLKIEEHPALAPHQMHCLLIVKDKELISMTELALLLDVSRQQLTRIVDSLVDIHLLNKIQNPTNRRQVLTCLSPEGEMYFDELIDHLREMTVHSFSELSEEEINEFLFHIKGLGLILERFS